MSTFLGMPRNAAIVLGAVLISAAALAAGFFIPWGNGAPGASDGGPAPVAPAEAAAVPVPPPAPTVAITQTASIVAPGATESSLAGIEYHHITVDFDNLNLEDALHAFSDASTLVVDGGNFNPRNLATADPVSMHLKNAPFLEGLLQLAHDTRTMPQSLTDTGASLRPQSDMAVGKYCVTGPFAVALQRLQVSADLTRPDMPMRGMLFLDLYAEPSVKVAQFPTSLSIDQFEDEKHQMLFVGNSYGSSGNTRNLPRVQLQMPMSLPADHGRKIGILRGSALFTIATKSQFVQTTSPEDTVKQTVGDVSIEIQPLKPSTTSTPPGAPRAMSLTVRYQRHVPDPEKWNRVVNMLTRLMPEVFDAADNPLQGNFYHSQERQGEDATTFHFELRVNPQPNGGGAAEPHHVRFEFPAETRDVRVPFEFKDILLP